MRTSSRGEFRQHSLCTSFDLSSQSFTVSHALWTFIGEQVIDILRRVVQKDLAIGKLPILVWGASLRWRTPSFTEVMPATPDATA